MVRLLGGFYGSGDEVTFNPVGGGYITSSGKQYTLSIPAQVSSEVSSITVVSATLTVRQNGNYVLGGADSQADMLSGGTVEVSAFEGYIRVTIRRTTAPSNVENNSGFGYIGNFKLKFN